MSRTAAVLPLKSPARAKSRLGGWDGRPGLAAAMAADVLAALSEARGLDEILVVAREAPGEVRGAMPVWVPDDREDGHVPAALLGVDAALERGAERVLLVPGDTPALVPADVEALLGEDAPVVVVPDRHGSGTNALLLRPPDVIRPSFGPGSFTRHVAFARAAGVAVRVAEPPSLLLDVDTAADLEALASGLTAGVAPRTRELLAAAP